MVFDAFTNVLSDGAGSSLTMTLVLGFSSFTYYCNGVTTLAVVLEFVALVVTTLTVTTALLHLDSPLLDSRSLRLFGDKADAVGTNGGTVAVGNTMVGETSGARATFINDQTSADAIYFKYYPGYGDPTIGLVEPLVLVLPPLFLVNR